MSWLKRFLGSSTEPPATTEPQNASEAPASKEAEAFGEILRGLTQFGADGGLGADEALSLLRRYEESPREAQVLAAVARGLTTSGTADELRVHCAQLLSVRGKAEQARELLKPVRSIHGLMLAAELHAAAGQLALAVSTIERVLARAIRTPGARDRHRRWMEQLGRQPHRRATVDDGATVLTALSDEDLPFRLLREVARGGAGTVYEAEDVTLGRRMAFKRYHDIEADRQQLEHEARTAAALRGPGVLAIYDANPESGWMTAEWVSGGTLADRIEHGDTDALWPLARWLLPLTIALARVHEAGWVHADIKPANILLRRLDDPILADFGAARRIGESHAHGTVGYMSPERLAGGVADPRDDIYALGRIIEDALTTDETQPQATTLAQLCIADEKQRPPNGQALLDHLVTAPLDAP